MEKEVVVPCRPSSEPLRKSLCCDLPVHWHCDSGDADVPDEKKEFQYIELIGFVTDFAKSTCKVYRLVMDFYNSRSTLYTGKQESELNDALNRLMWSTNCGGCELCHGVYECLLRKIFKIPSAVNNFADGTTSSWDTTHDYSRSSYHEQVALVYLCSSLLDYLHSTQVTY